jgi:hypothetical protein
MDLTWDSKQLLLENALRHLNERVLVDSQVEWSDRLIDGKDLQGHYERTDVTNECCAGFRNLKLLQLKITRTCVQKEQSSNNSP